MYNILVYFLGKSFSLIKISRKLLIAKNYSVMFNYIMYF